MGAKSDDVDDAQDFYLFILNTTSVLGVSLGVACNPPKILMGHCERGARSGMSRQQARVHSSVLHFCNLPCFACCLLTVVFVIAFTCQSGCCRLGFLYVYVYVECNLNCSSHGYCNLMRLHKTIKGSCWMDVDSEGQNHLLP